MGDQEINLMLVKEIEKCQVLYNFHLPGYSKKHETEKAWKEVGNVVNLTGAECKERWKNIRAVFVRHLKPPKSGSGTKEKKAYYLADAMQFTVPYIKALGKPSGNLLQPPLKEVEEVAGRDGNIIVDDDDDDVDDDLSETPTPSTSALPPAKPSTSSSSATTAFPQSEPTNYHNVTKKKRPKNDNVDKAFMEYLERKRATLSAKGEQLATDPKEEALKMFLLSMLPDLMKMEDTEVRQFKRKVLDTVDDILSSKSTRSPSLVSTRNSTFSNENEMPAGTTDGDGGYSTLADYYSTSFHRDA